MFRYELKHEQYWNLILDDTYTIAANESTTRTFSYTQGMSKSQETTMSSELGIEVSGSTDVGFAKFSSKISAKFGYSTTNAFSFTESSTITKEVNIDATPHARSVYTWQLVDRISLCRQCFEMGVGWISYGPADGLVSAVEQLNLPDTVYQYPPAP